jgi:hypothetical protein
MHLLITKCASSAPDADFADFADLVHTPAKLFLILRNCILRMLQISLIDIFDRFVFRPLRSNIEVVLLTFYVSISHRSLFHILTHNPVGIPTVSTLECQLCQNCNFALNPFFNIDLILRMLQISSNRLKVIPFPHQQAVLAAQTLRWSSSHSMWAFHIVLFFKSSLSIQLEYQLCLSWNANFVRIVISLWIPSEYELCLLSWKS